MLSEETIKKAHKIIGENVAKARKERNISQLALSLEMGYKSVSLVSFAEICLKDTHFNITHLLQISNILKVPLAELLKGVDEVIK